ncbi:MAG: cyclic nucleotide-binding domain-containing protein [Proteobacteria bacterium]|nr:cyclic nucleotide-binding domain-containing protein [Pseudomonadota bacterium]
MRLDEIIALLARIPIFEAVDPEALRLLAFSAVRRQLRPGDILFRRNDYSDGGYLVVEGEIVLDMADSGAPSPHVFGPGALIGQSALFAQGQRPATAIARGQTTVLVFSRELMMKVLDAHPESAAVLRDALVREAREMAARLRRLA